MAQRESRGRIPSATPSRNLGGDNAPFPSSSGSGRPIPPPKSEDDHSEEPIARQSSRDPSALHRVRADSRPAEHASVRPEPPSSAASIAVTSPGAHITRAQDAAGPPAWPHDTEDQPPVPPIIHAFTLTQAPLPPLRRDTQKSFSFEKIIDPGNSDERPAFTPGHRRGEPIDLSGSRSLDWIVPAAPNSRVHTPSEKVDAHPRRMNEPHQFHVKSIGERLDPTLEAATAEREKRAWKARITGYLLNVAIALQVIFGALITALAATKTASTSTAVLGGFSTLIASYLARARGAGEPEKSHTMVKELDQFIRECQAFKMDHGHVMSRKYDENLDHFRRQFEEIMGNINAERRQSSPA